MAGLQLRSSIGASGTFTPLTPAAANPTTRTNAIAEIAYGINGGDMPTGNNVATYGSIAIGAAALTALVFLWFSLPR